MNETPLPQRKSPVHQPPLTCHNRSTIIAATVCTDKRKRILAHDDVHSVLVAAWQAAVTWSVGRYVVLPDHIHLFCAPQCWDAPALEKWVQFWKSWVSRRWPRPVEQPVWEKSFWDTQLRRGESYADKWEYMWKIRSGTGWWQVQNSGFFKGN